MRLSQFENIKKENLINEKEFETLGILASKVDKKLCTFIDDEKYIKDLKSNFVMIITTKKIYEELLDRDFIWWKIQE